MNGTDTNIPNSSSTGSEPNNNDGLVIKNGILEQCVTRNRSVAVPSGVHTIGKGAFKGCTSLEAILLPDTVTVISDDAFKEAGGDHAAGQAGHHRQLRISPLPQPYSHHDPCLRQGAWQLRLSLL